ASKVWVKGDPNLVAASHYEPQFLATELEYGQLTPAEWRKASEAWDRAHQAHMSDFERWVLRWGTAIGREVGADEAMAHRPSAGEPTSASPLLARWIGGMEAYEGRLRLDAGDAAAAVPLLEKASRACNAIDRPFLNVRSHLWLGKAKEK